MPVKLYFTTGISNWLCVNSDSVDTQQPITRARGVWGTSILFQYLGAGILFTDGNTCPTDPQVLELNTLFTDVGQGYMCERLFPVHTC